MRSRAARVTVGAMAWMAIGASALLLIRIEQQLDSGRAAARAFDACTVEVSQTLGELRSAQQAYVAAGQGLAYWTPRVTTAVERASTGLAELSATAVSADARRALGEASAALTDFSAADRRAHEYLKSGQSLMAADVIFTEGGGAATSAVQHVETARAADLAAGADTEQRFRRQQAFAAGGAGALAALIILLLVPTPRGSDRGAAFDLRFAVTESPDEGVVSEARPVRSVEPISAPAPASEPPTERTPASATRAASPVLRAAAQLCTDFSRVSTVDELRQLLARAADMMDASGVVVWAGSVDGADLRPVLSHGYSSQTLAQMPPLARSADNAAAAAYRTGRVQIVPGRPGAAGGAIVAPIVNVAGCVGAFSAEIRDGGESSDAVQALAAIFAAQLAGVLGTEPQGEQSSVATR